MFIKRDLLSGGLEHRQCQFNNLVYVLEKFLRNIPPHKVSIATLSELNHGRKTFSQAPNDQTYCVIFYGEDNQMYVIWQTVDDELFHLRQIKARNGDPENVGYYITDECRDGKTFTDIMKYMIGHKIY